MKEFLSKYKLQLLVAVVGVFVLLWFNGVLKSCDVESLSASTTSITSENPVEPASTTITSENPVSPAPITSQGVASEEGTEN